MVKRLKTSGVILATLAVAFVTKIWTPFVFDLVMLALAVTGSVEVARVLERQGKYTNFIAVGTMPAYLYLALILTLRFHLAWQYLLLFFLGGIVVYFLVVFLITILSKTRTKAEMDKYSITDVKPTQYAVDKAIYSLTVLVYPTLLFMSLIAINHFYEFSFIVNNTYDFKMLSWFLLVGVFAVTMVTDSMAYVVGSTLKGPKLCPLISPNKTISGALGGLVFGAGSGMAVYGFFTFSDQFKEQLDAINCPWWLLLILFVVASILGQIGDIFASALKRRSRVKDYGSVLPGHGGVMDRVDALIFVSSFIFIAFVLFFLI